MNMEKSQTKKPKIKLQKGDIIYLAKGLTYNRNETLAEGYYLVVADGLLSLKQYTHKKINQLRLDKKDDIKIYTKYDYKVILNNCRA